MTSAPIRKGARTLAKVPSEVLAEIEAGRIETVNLMEWLAASMPTLARAVARETTGKLSAALAGVANLMEGHGVTGRLRVAGREIALATGAEGTDFELLAAHRADIVRQWACYAANDESVSRPMDVRIAATRRFADDHNMSVRETAWMAFRPHLAADVERGLRMLLPLTRSPSENVRRFAVEVTRPRSVWGAHILTLKQHPERAVSLLDSIMRDESRYVKLAAGNWLNDASKSRPDWAAAFCARWTGVNDRHTDFIIKRGGRSLSRSSGIARSHGGLLEQLKGEAA